MSNLATQLKRDLSGSVLPMAAIGVIVIAALVGGAVDMSRAYRVQNRLQNACDAGALAGRRAVTTNGFDATSQTQANRYFDVNFDSTLQGVSSTSRTFASNSTANTITGTVSTQLPMTLMKIFGKQTMTIQATCTSTMGVGNSDITMVLDVTGSMDSTLGSGTRISALKTAVKGFRDTMGIATSGTNARVRYAFVPFSTSVNVGSLLKALNPSYIADSLTVQSRLARFEESTTVKYNNWTGWVNSSVRQYASTPNSSVTQHSTTAYSDIYSCNAAKPADTNWSNNGSSSTSTGTTNPVKNGSGLYVPMTILNQPQKMTSYMCQRSSGNYYINKYDSYSNLYTYTYATTDAISQSSTATTFDHFDYRPVTYDTSLFKTFSSTSTPTGSNGVAESSTWAGCIEERNTSASSTFSYSTISGITPSEAFDLDLDSAPTSDPATKWAPLWTKLAYTRGTNSLSTSGSAASSYCVPAAKGLQEMDKSSYDTYVDSLTADGYTYLDIGMIWGGRLSSPEGIFSDTVNLAPTNGANTSRHLIFMTDGDMNTVSSIYQSYGIESYDLRVTSNGSSTQDDARHSLRFRAVCDAIKAKGIRIWVIAFTTSMNADLTYCTSPGSSFTASTSSQLNAAFQNIAKQVGELRVLQ